MGETGKDPIIFENQHFDNNYSVNVSWLNAPTTYPLHWHTYGEIICGLQDQLIFNIQGKDYHINENDILFIWPGELHATIKAEPASHLIVQFSNNLLSISPEMHMLMNRVLSIHQVSSDASGSTSAEISRRMTEIRQTYSMQIPLVDTRLCLSLYHIFLELYDYSLECMPAYSENPSHDLHTIQAITKACCYISENCQRNISLEEVAEHAGLSKFHFSRLFKEYTQTGFCDYMAAQRIQKAIILFDNPEISIAEAAFQSGFGSIASFNRCFRKIKGCTPSRYRELLANPE